MEKLLKEEDFKWYCVELDLHNRYENCHIGYPERYPCMVESKFSDPSNGPYTYSHSFKYKKDVKCKSCGHTQKEF